MVLESLWVTLEETGLSVAIREVPFAFAAVEIIHVLALSTVFGSLLIVDLRLLGLAGNYLKVNKLSDSLLRWTWAGFAIAALSGIIMFMARAREYLINDEFIAKFIVMALAGINMLIFHYGVYRGVDKWASGQPPAAAKLAGFLSLACWVVIIFLGRWIGYTIGVHV